MTQCPDRQSGRTTALGITTSDTMYLPRTHLLYDRDDGYSRSSLGTNTNATTSWMRNILSKHMHVHGGSTDEEY